MRGLILVYCVDFLREPAYPAIIYRLQEEKAMTSFSSVAVA